MKRVFVCIAVLVLLCCSCSQSASQNVSSASSFLPSQMKFDPVEAKKFIVNKKDVSDTATAFIYSDRYAVVPLIAVSKAFGAQVKWESKTKAVITAHGDEYILDTLKNELNYAATGTNIFIGVPGAPGNMYGYNKQVGEEYYIDNWRVQAFLNNFGVGHIEIDFYSGSVYINKEEPEKDICGEFSVDDYAEEIQRIALDLENSKDGMSAGKLAAYSKNYGDLNSAVAVRYAAFVAFSMLYEEDGFTDCGYTAAELDVFRDETASCWLVKLKSYEELLMSYKPNVLLIDFGCMAIFNDDGKLLLSANTNSEGNPTER